MLEWLQLSKRRRLELLRQTSAKTGLVEDAIEKDWWVTLALKAAFSTEWSDNLVFKGGTSLSKAWNLIERFSEDIDLVIDREVFGFSESLTNSQITALRKRSFEFTSNIFREAIEEQIIAQGIVPTSFSLSAQESRTSDKDPQVLELYYDSVLDNNAYLNHRVLIEIGARSLREPSSSRIIQSIIGSFLTDSFFAEQPFSIQTVDPKRTFLEKIFLLHEEFLKPFGTIRHERMSRHLYDLERLMDTEHGYAALIDTDLYNIIIEHRKKFNKVRGIEYTKHIPSQVNFIPPAAILPQWEEDYRLMRQSMIYGQSLEFHQLIDRLNILVERLRDIE